MLSWGIRSKHRLELRRKSPFLRSPIDAIHRTRLKWSAAFRSGKVQEQAEPLTEYAHDPVGFCRDVLGVEVWSVKDYPAGDNPKAGGQVEILESVRDHPRVSVAACYASGKTFTAACLVLWWMYTRRPAMVVTTAPTFRQVKNVLWREIKKLHRKARRRLPGRVLQTQIEINDDWWGMGFSSDAPNSVAGLHEAKNVLFIEDEAAGMEPEVVEGFEGITAGDDSRHLKIGNPICVSGPFYDSHEHPEESKRWKRISIDAEDTPNVREGRSVVPGLVGRDWVEDKRHKWLIRGLLHLWETRVKGRFYVTAGEKVIPKEWIRLAQERWATAPEGGSQDLSVDVAGGGRDESSSYKREGRRVRHLDNWQDDDLMRQANRVAEMAEREKVQRLFIDKTGLGQGLFNRLVQMQEEEGRMPGVKIVGVGLGGAAVEKEIYNSRGDEVQFSLRWALNPENPDAIAIDPENKKLAEELNWRGWWTNERHLIQCDSKKKLKAEHGGSPDDADSVALLFAEPEKKEGWFFST